MMKEAKAKEMLKDKVSLLRNSKDELFGQQFQEDWTNTMKSKNKYKKLMKQPIKSNPVKKPFRGGPQPRGSGG